MNKHLNPKVQEALDTFDKLVDKVGTKAIADGYLSIRTQDGVSLNDFVKQNGLYITPDNSNNKETIHDKRRNK